LALGYPHPDYLLDSLTSKQVQEWVAYNQLEPIGEYRRDYMEGQILAMIQNTAQALYGKKGKRSTSRPEDYIPWGQDIRRPVEPKQVQSPEEIKALFMDLKKGMRQTHGSGRAPKVPPPDEKE
jgi:hypothetical protein